MKIILKYVITNVREHKTRTAVMLMSVLLSSSLLFVSFSIGVSYESAQRKMARGMAGSATVSVSSLEGTTDAGIIPELSAIKTQAGILKGTALYHENGYYETVDMIAADIGQLNQINKPRMVDGSDMPDMDGYQVVLPDRFTSKYGIEKGDSVRLLIAGNSVEFEVAAVAAYDTLFLRHTRGTTALLPLPVLMEILGQDNGYGEILIEPSEGVSTEELIAQLRSVLPDSYQVSRIVNEAQVKADARQKSMPFFLISFFSMTMSVFIIYSSYKVITLDRLPVIGTFRSIGATKTAVTYILLAESMLYGITGGLLGLPAGIMVLRIILGEMGQTLAQGIEIPVVISLPGMVMSFCAAVITSLLSAWIPIRRASRLPIKDVVLGTVEEKYMPGRLIVATGAVLFAVSAILPDIAPDNMLYVAGGFSLLGLIAATILIIPVITNLLSALLEPVYGAIFKNEGWLAARNIRDNKNVVQNITLLFISISAVIAISVVGSFVTTYISDVFKDAELQGFADGTMEPDFVEQVKNMEGIEKVLPLYVFENEVQAGGVTLSRLEATDNLSWYNSMLGLHYTDEAMETDSEAVFYEKKSIIASESCLERTGFSVGDTITLTRDAEQGTYYIAGSFKSRATDVEAVTCSHWVKGDFDVTKYGFLAYTATDPDAVMVQIRDLFGDTWNWSRTVEEFNEDAHSTVGAFLQPMHSMTYFILMLAAMGIVNNQLINYMQKRRIIAMYRAVGLGRGQNAGMMLIEGLTSGWIGAAVAVIVSYVEIRTVFIVAGPKISMAPDLDMGTFIVAGAMGVLVTLAGCVVPIIKGRRMRLMEEIKYE